MLKSTCTRQVLTPTTHSKTATHLDLCEHAAHHVDGRLVSCLLVTLAKPGGGGWQDGVGCATVKAQLVRGSTGHL